MCQSVLISILLNVIKFLVSNKIAFFLYYLYGINEVLHDVLGDRKDQKTLERLRAERQAKIDELKEKTNYYSTQQLIQV